MRRDEGKLTWTEFSQLLRLRLNGLLIARNYATSQDVAAKIKDILPETLQGPALLALDDFLEALPNIMRYPRLAAETLLQWSLAICRDQELSANLKFSLAVLKELSGDLQGGGRGLSFSFSRFSGILCTALPHWRNFIGAPRI